MISVIDVPITTRSMTLATTRIVSFDDQVISFATTTKGLIFIVVSIFTVKVIVAAILFIIIVIVITFIAATAANAAKTVAAILFFFVVVVFAAAITSILSRLVATQLFRHILLAVELVANFVGEIDISKQNKVSDLQSSEATIPPTSII